MIMFHPSMSYKEELNRVKLSQVLSALSSRTSKQSTSQEEKKKAPATAMVENTPAERCGASKRVQRKAKANPRSKQGKLPCTSQLGENSLNVFFAKSSPCKCLGDISREAGSKGTLSLQDPIKMF